MLLCQAIFSSAMAPAPGMQRRLLSLLASGSRSAGDDGTAPTTNREPPGAATTHLGADPPQVQASSSPRRHYHFVSLPMLHAHRHHRALGDADMACGLHLHKPIAASATQVIVARTGGCQL